MEPEYSTEPEITTGGHGAEIAAVFLAAIICVSVAYAFGVNNNWQSKKTTNLLTVQTSQMATTSIYHLDPFAMIEIEAKAVYVFDVRTQKVIFAKNAYQSMPLASITKIMTADVVTEDLSKNADITIDESALSQDGDSGLFVGEKWNSSKLLDFTLAVSSNDGAVALAEAVGPDFVDKMNEKAKSLGLSSMHFYNATGLDVSPSVSGGYGSAADTAKLFEYTLNTHPDILGATTYSEFIISSLSNIKHTAINTDEDVNKIPGIIASKTGFTDLAGGNLGIIYDASLNYPVIAIVLGSTYDARFSDMAKIIDATNQTLSLQKQNSGL